MFILTIFVLSFYFYGYNETWELWGIQTMTPHFADVRTITHGAESFAQGYDPLYENPEDPWQRKLVYPRIWQGLFYLGLNSSHSTSMGILWIISFLVGIILFLKDADNKTHIFVFALVLSPATLLGVERGSLDLLMFFFLSLTIIAIQRSYFIAAVALFTGFILKLFPIFAWIIFIKGDSTKFIWSTIGAFLLVSLYITYNYADFKFIWSYVPRSTNISFGKNVVVTAVDQIDNILTLVMRVTSYFAVAITFALAYFDPLKSKQKTYISNRSKEQLYQDAFRVGATLYISIFLLFGNSWDYRLIFLIFTVPQLLKWASVENHSIKVISKIALVTIILSFWSRILFSPHLFGRHIALGMDELSNWLVFASLLYLFFWSLPVRFKLLIGKRMDN